MTLFDTFGDSRTTIATAHKERTRCPTLTSSMLPKLHSGALAYERFAKSIAGGIFGRHATHNGHLGDALKIDANDPITEVGVTDLAANHYLRGLHWRIGLDGQWTV